MSKYQELFREAKSIIEKRIEPDKDKREQKERENLRMSRDGKVLAAKLVEKHKKNFIYKPLDYFLSYMRASLPPYKKYYAEYYIFDSIDRSSLDNEVFKYSFISALKTLIEEGLAKEVRLTYYDFAVVVDYSIDADKFVIKVNIKMNLCY